MARLFEILWICLVLSNSSFAGDTRGSGGDLIQCQPSKDNLFSGYYSLDYLATFSSTAADRPVASTIQKQLGSISKLLDEKLPKFAKAFEIFAQDYRNVKNPSRRYYWEEVFGLVDLFDEELVNQVPANCLSGGVLHLEQAVIRQSAEQSGLPEGTTLFKFIPNVIDSLEKNSVLQLSYLLVHEWLWDWSKNVERNRRINRFLHSEELASLSPEDALKKLKALGLDPENPFLKDEDSLPIASLLCKSGVGSLSVLLAPMRDECKEKLCSYHCGSDKWTVETRGYATSLTQGRINIYCACRVPGMGRGDWTCTGQRNDFDFPGVKKQLFTGHGESRYAAEMDVFRKCSNRKVCDILSCQAK